MEDEKVIRQEEPLLFGGMFFPKKGTLVLTESSLFFVQKAKNIKLFSVPIKNILNVRAQFFSGRGSTLLISYKDGTTDKKLEVRYNDPKGFIRLTAAFREPYFKSWEKLIDDTRLGVSSISI